jgi:hypothetical protein
MRIDPHNSLMQVASHDDGRLTKDDTEIGERPAAARTKVAGCLA